MANESTEITLTKPRLEYPGDKILEPAFKLALLGLSDQQLADIFADGDLASLHAWYEEYHGFRAMVHQGRVYADAEVANALFKRATGYELNDTRKRYVVDKDAPNGQRLVSWEERVIHVPASVDAIELWLRTRQRELWPEKPKQLEDPNNIPGKPGVSGNDVGQELLSRVEAVLTRAADQVEEADAPLDPGPDLDPEAPVD